LNLNTNSYLKKGIKLLTLEGRLGRVLRWR
jgi:hypothetical protein